MPPRPPSRRQVADARRFNRFYTRQIGLLNEGLHHSAFSLTEVRVLYELAHGSGTTASALAAALDLDHGYLSRMLRRFTRGGLVRRTASKEDRRRATLALTAKGRDAFAPLDRKSDEQVRTLLAPLAAGDRDRLLASMRTIESLLGGDGASDRSYAVRGPRPGDMGWITHRHGVLYAQEYGWDWTFEALVGEITAQFAQRFDAAKEKCWIAERSGMIAGSIFCVRESDTVARLRLLYVEPWARGLGIGGGLVKECIAFAKAAGYGKMVLWTNDVLHAARRIYQAEGFTLSREERHHSYGKDLTGQYWELALRA